MKTARYEDKVKKRRRGNAGDVREPSTNNASGDETLNFSLNLLPDESINLNDGQTAVSLGRTSSLELNKSSTAMPKEKRKKLNPESQTVLSEAFLREISEDTVRERPAKSPAFIPSVQSIIKNKGTENVPKISQRYAAKRDTRYRPGADYPQLLDNSNNLSLGSIFNITAGSIGTSTNKTASPNKLLPGPIDRSNKQKIRFSRTQPRAKHPNKVPERDNQTLKPGDVLFDSVHDKAILPAKGSFAPPEETHTLIPQPSDIPNLDPSFITFNDKNVGNMSPIKPSNEKASVAKNPIKKKTPLKKRTPKVPSVTQPGINIASEKPALKAHIPKASNKLSADMSEASPGLHDVSLFLEASAKTANVASEKPALKASKPTGKPAVKKRDATTALDKEDSNNDLAVSAPAKKINGVSKKPASKHSTSKPKPTPAALKEASRHLKENLDVIPAKKTNGVSKKPTAKPKKKLGARKYRSLTPSNQASLQLEESPLVSIQASKGEDPSQSRPPKKKLGDLGWRKPRDPLPRSQETSQDFSSKTVIKVKVPIKPAEPPQTLEEDVSYTLSPMHLNLSRLNRVKTIPVSVTKPSPVLEESSILSLGYSPKSDSPSQAVPSPDTSLPESSRKKILVSKLNASSSGDEPLSAVDFINDQFQKELLLAPSAGPSLQKATDELCRQLEASLRGLDQTHKERKRVAKELAFIRKRQKETRAQLLQERKEGLLKEARLKEKRQILHDLSNKRKKAEELKSFLGNLKHLRHDASEPRRGKKASHPESFTLFELKARLAIAQARAGVPLTNHSGSLQGNIAQITQELDDLEM